MKIDKSLFAKSCGVGFSAFILKALILIAVYKEVVIMEPNLFILYGEIATVTVFLILSIQGLLQRPTLKSSAPKVTK